MNTTGCEPGYFTDNWVQNDLESIPPCTSHVGACIAYCSIYITISLLNCIIVWRTWLLQHFSRTAYSIERRTQAGGDKNKKYYCKRRLPVVPIVNIFGFITQASSLIFVCFKYYQFSKWLGIGISQAIPLKAALKTKEKQSKMIINSRSSLQNDDNVQSEEQTTIVSSSQQVDSIHNNNIPPSPLQSTKTVPPHQLDQNNNNNQFIIKNNMKIIYLRRFHKIIKMILVGMAFTSLISFCIIFFLCTLLFPANQDIVMGYFLITATLQLIMGILIPLHQEFNIRDYLEIARNNEKNYTDVGHARRTRKSRYLRMVQFSSFLTLITIAIIHLIVGIGYFRWYLVLSTAFFGLSLFFFLNLIHYSSVRQRNIKAMMIKEKKHHEHHHPIEERQKNNNNSNANGVRSEQEKLSEKNCHQSSWRTIAENEEKLSSDRNAHQTSWKTIVENEIVIPTFEEAYLNGFKWERWSNNFEHEKTEFAKRYSEWLEKGKI